MRNSRFDRPALTPPTFRPLSPPRLGSSRWRLLLPPLPVRPKGLDFANRMKRLFGKGLLLLASAGALALVSPKVDAQQCCPDLGPIKWLQTPDLFSNITVNASEGLTLADDFLCTNQGPIIDIHIWGGWLYDQADPGAVFTLGIWSDVPAVTNGPAPIPSHPGQLLWSQAFGPGEYTQCFYATNGGPFFNPTTAADIGGMQNLYYLCFNPTNPFVQMGTAAAPTNYWLSLSVQSDPAAGFMFGWRDSLDAYNDTAVWVQGTPPPPGSWNELKGDAPFYRPLNLAFKVITATNQPPPPPVCVETNALKFVQPPNIDAGFNVWDNGPWVLADDFNCTNTGPITDIHLWGSWLNNQVDTNVSFWLGIYTDVPKTTNADGSINPSHPGDMQWQQWFAPGQYAKELVGNGQENFLDPGPPAVIGSDSQAWYYCFYPTNPFVQTGTTAAPKIYWLAVYAQTPAGSNEQFGWLSSLLQQNDISVHAQWPGGAPPNPWSWQPTFTPFGNPLDLAFKIDTATNQCPPPQLLCSNQLVQCGTAWTLTPPPVNDPCCAGSVNVTPLTIVTNGACPQVITVTWLATDCRGLTDTCTETISIVDTTPPVLICGTNKTIECGIAGTVVFDTPYVYDACCTNVTLSVLSTLTNGTCPQVLTRTWLAVDCCGNTNTCSQTVTVVDTTPPSIICPTNKTVECGTTWTFDTPVAYDTCCTNVTLFVLGTVTNGVCPQVLTRIWVAADCCGNTNMCSQTVTVVDTTPPTIICPTNKVVECGTPWNFDTPVAYDNCCTNVLVSVASTVTNGVCPQAITRTWVAVDCCNNRSLCSQTVTVVDTTPPTIICPTNKVVECGTTWAFDTPVVYDNCCTNVTLFVLSTFTNGVCPQQVTRTWLAQDCCGNTNTCSQTVTVVDTTPPTIICPTNKVVECGTTWVFDTPIVYDNCCTNVGLLVLSTVTNGVCPQQVTRTWLAQDCCGNTNSCSQTVLVVDTTPPSITCPSNIVVVTCDTNAVVNYTVTATDACSTNVTVVCIPPSGYSFPRGTNTVHCVATDQCGNSSTCDFQVRVEAPRMVLTITHHGGTIVLTWSFGVLQEADNPMGPWTDVPGATSPYTVPGTGPHKFYRLRCP